MWTFTMIAAFVYGMIAGIIYERLREAIPIRSRRMTMLRMFAALFFPLIFTGLIYAMWPKRYDKPENGLKNWTFEE